MQKQRSSRIAMLTTAMLLAFGLALVSLPASAATVCNTSGCYNASIKRLEVDAAGRIWFIVDNSAALTILNLPGGCVLKSKWTGTAEPALYIRPQSPSTTSVAADQYALLLTSFTTGAKLLFGPALDPATGWCSVNYVNIYH